MMTGRKIIITGAVQGVGFRPFVYRLAASLGIRGWVRNDARGVVIAACAEAPVMETFITRIQTTYPPLATVRSIDVESIAVEAWEDFAIIESAQGERVVVDVTRDAAVCEACLMEMRDPHNRRFRHAFINCTNCGPRFTIIKSLPYDRPATTMAAFPMCPKCAREYATPSDRRFHAQPICCPDCGPRLSLLDANGKPSTVADPLLECVELIESGAIVAIKGLGGFHIACRADNPEAVARLRFRKNREAKPLAVMVAVIDDVENFVELGSDAARVLMGIERPIVVCPKKAGICLAPNIAPGLPTLGIMLPYTPVHHLLFSCGRTFPLVMTSGNLTDEPIVYKNDEAVIRLSGIADAFLTHDRGIYLRNDDSVIRAASGGPVMMRRSRGYVPDPLPTPFDVQGLAALGGVLKSTVAVGRKKQCYLSQYVGAITTVEGMEELTGLIEHFRSILGMSITGFAADLHPDSIFQNVITPGSASVTRIQHHHAHAAACMAENELAGKALCLVYDGTGYGLDGCIWGGELLYTGYADFSRLGHMAYMQLPGADAAIKKPGRMAIAALYSKIGDEACDALPWMPEDEKTAVIDMVRSKTGCVATSSMGRLFDAVSAMLGVCVNRTYEGQPAIELEGCAEADETGEYDPLAVRSGEGIIVDGAGILLQAYRDFTSGASRERVSARFHQTVARASAIAARMAADITGCRTVCLSGGCFQNTLLLTRTVALLTEAGLRPFMHRRLPPNDECIAYGQLVIAGARRALEGNLRYP